MEPKHIRFQLTITLRDIILLAILVFIILAFFMGWNN